MPAGRLHCVAARRAFRFYDKLISGISLFGDKSERLIKRIHARLQSALLVPAAIALEQLCVLRCHRDKQMPAVIIAQMLAGVGEAVLLQALQYRCNCLNFDYHLSNAVRTRCELNFIARDAGRAHDAPVQIGEPRTPCAGYGHANLVRLAV